MPELEITCSRCKSTLHHECHPETLEEAAIDLFMWRPESGFPKKLKGNGDGSENDETVPFLTESFLYPLLGKDDARSLMARVHSLFRALGVEPRDFELKAWEILDKKKRDHEAEMARRAEARKRYRELMQPVMRSKQTTGFVVCRYQSFYCFDTNVGACAHGECFELDDGKQKYVGDPRPKPKLGKVVRDLDGMHVECGNCKRIHLATPEQVENWRKEPRYPSRTAKEARESGREPSKPEHWIRARCIFEALGFKDEPAKDD
jgi:hypothetical protein